MIGCNKNNKGKIKRIRDLAMLMVITIAISFFPIIPAVVYGAEKPKTINSPVLYDDNEGSSSSLEELKKELQNAQKAKQEKQARLNEAEGRLQETENSLNQLNSIKKGYQGELNSLNAELQLVADKLEVIEADLELKNIEILETEVALGEAEERSITQYESMKARIQFLYESSDTVYMNMLFSSSSFGEFLNYADYIEQLNEYDRRMLDEYVATQEAISANIVKLNDEKAEIEALESEAEAEKAKVMELITGTSENLASTADTIKEVNALAAAYEADCDKKAAEAAAAEAEYEAIKKEYEEELRLSQLAAISSWRDISQVTFDEGDRYLLANLIYCEAGGEPYEGQVAVGAVVINRLLSSVFPNTVTGVIYQNKQFSPVKDGHLASALANNKATESCYRAADAAMSGATNVGGCVFFRTPIEGLTGLQIGHHIFY